METTAIEKVINYYSSIVNALPIGGYGVKVLHDALVELAALKTAERQPTAPNSQSAAALKDCIQLFASLKLALGVLKTMCRVAGLNGGMQKAVDMDLWIDEMVERLNAEAALRT